MALNPKMSTASKTLAENAGLNAALDVCNNGFLDIYSGTQPTDPNTALGAQVKLAHLPLAATAFGAASAGAKTAGTITADVGLDTGTAAWFTLTKSDGTRVYEDTVGTSGAAINLNTTAIVTGAAVSVTSLIISATI